MAKQTEVVVEIDHKGRIQIHVDNHQGQSCKKLLEPFRKGLGKVVKEGLKPEYHKAEDNQNVIVSNVRVSR